MLCLQVQINDQPPCTAGIQDAIMFSAQVSGFIGFEESPAVLRLAGMCDLGGERSAHVYWHEALPLQRGDQITFRLVQSDSPTPYSELVPTDSAEYLEEQRQFHEAEAAYEPPTEQPNRLWPSVRLKTSINNEQAVRMGYSVCDSHLLCSLDWIQYRPERLRVYARSFSGASANLDSSHIDWLRANLGEGDIVTIEVDA
jgi:hypothetical protein